MSLSDLENQAAELASFLSVPLEGIWLFDLKKVFICSLCQKFLNTLIFEKSYDKNEKKLLKDFFKYNFY